MFLFVRQRIYLQLALALAAGTALGALAPPPLALLRDSWWLWALLLGALAGLWWHHRAGPGALPFVPGYALLVLLGYLNCALALSTALAAPLRGYVSGQAASAAAQGQRPAGLRLEGRVASLPKLQRGHLRFMLALPGPAQYSASAGGAALARPRAVDSLPLGRCLVFLQVKQGLPPPDVNYGDVVQLTGDVEEVPPPRNRGQFDYRAWLRQQGTVLSAYSFGGGGLHVILPAPSGLWAGLARLRARLTAQLAAHAPPDLAPLAVSVVYGDKITELPEATTQSFQRAGLSHILVASGTQVSLLIALLAALGWRQHGDFSPGALPGRLAAAGLTCGAVLVYAGIAGLETSILRALVMGVVVLSARLLRRESDGLTSLAQAALVVLIASPQQLFNAGFQLSFGATFGLIYLNGLTLPWLRPLGQPPPGLAPPASTAAGWSGLRDRLGAQLPQWRRQGTVIALEALSTTIGAQLFVLPVLAAGFNQLSLWGFASNALAVPLSFALLIVGGAASLGLGSLPVVSGVFDWAVGSLTALLAGVATFFGQLPGANLAVPAPPWWYVLAAYGLLLLGGEWLKQARPAVGEPAQAATAASPAPGTDRAVPGAVPLLTGLSVLTLTAGLLYWLLVPQPELAALALPGAEAYVYRPPGRAPWVILRSRGLSRSRNADSVTAALRARGINRLGGVVWANQPLEPDPLADYPAPRLAPGDSLPVSSGLAWLTTPAGEPFGVALRTGRRTCHVLWASPGGALPALLSLPAQGAAPAVLLLAEPLAEELRPGTLRALAHVGPLYVLNGRRPLDGSPPANPLQAGREALLPGDALRLVSATELDVRPHGAGVTLLQYGRGRIALDAPP